MSQVAIESKLNVCEASGRTIEQFDSNEHSPILQIHPVVRAQVTDVVRLDLLPHLIHLSQAHFAVLLIGDHAREPPQVEYERFIVDDCEHIYLGSVLQRLNSILPNFAASTCCRRDSMAHGVYSISIPEQTMTDSKAQLRQIFRTMDGNRAQEIREASYKAIEGLMTLARELELADADLADSPTPLLDQHMYAVTALEAMGKSLLGKVL